MTYGALLEYLCTLSERDLELLVQVLVAAQRLVVFRPDRGNGALDTGITWGEPAGVRD